MFLLQLSGQRVHLVQLAVERVGEALVGDAADVPAETEHDEAADVQWQRFVCEVEARGGDRGEQGGYAEGSRDLPPHVHRARGDCEQTAHTGEQRRLAGTTADVK